MTMSVPEMRVLFFILSACVAPSAIADEPIEWTAETELTLVAGAFSDEARPEPRSGMGEISLSAGAAKLFDNGVEVSVNGTFRAQTDHPRRAGFAGQPVSCPASSAECPAFGVFAPRGGFSRLTLGGPTPDIGGRGSLESLYLTVDGGWGELTLGRDTGVANRFYEGGRTVFRLASSSDPILDPTGLVTSRTRNDISSTAEKVSYTTPRILGVRAGISVTPDASVRRLDLTTNTNTHVVLEPELGQVVEVGLQGSRLLRDADLRVRGSLTYSRAEIERAPYTDMDTVAFGFEVERRDVFSLGVSGLNSSNGGLGDYTSFAIGGSYELGAWSLGADIAVSEDESLNLEGQSFSLGLSRDLNETISLTIGYQNAEITTPLPGIVNETDTKQEGVLLEVRIRPDFNRSS